MHRGSINRGLTAASGDARRAESYYIGFMNRFNNAPPIRPRVQLFATCLGDLVFPRAVADAVSLLEAAGFAVDFPRGQVCCGQPAFNAGHRGAAARVARTFVRAFSRDTPIIAPSGSCVAMVAHQLPKLLGVAGYEIFELSSFLAANDFVPIRCNTGVVVSYHDSCHMARDLGVRDAPRILLEASGAVVQPLPRADLCCGFGGTFAIRHPEISVAMADDKLQGSAPTLVSADPGCLLQLGGRSSRTNGVRAVHLATALARGAT